MPDAAKIPDAAVFDVRSPWYQKALDLFNECASRGHTAGHLHHWIPCAVIAKILHIGRVSNYRELADLKYPQRLVMMPPGAHMLIHYYIWKAVKRRFHRSMLYAFAAFYTMNIPEDAYTKVLAACLKEESSAELRQINIAREWSPRKRTTLDDIPEPTQFTDMAAALKECSLRWREYSGPNGWPKFQHHFMKKFKEGQRKMPLKVRQRIKQEWVACRAQKAAMSTPL